MAKFMVSMLPNAKELKFSKPLKDACKVLIPLGEEYWKDQLEELKDVPLDITHGCETTARDMQIHLSEKMMKPMFGDDIFGQVMAMRIAQTPAKHIIISDGGFLGEAKQVRRSNANCRAVHITRPGYDFAGDSRNYVDYKSIDIPVTPVSNEYDLELYEAQTKRILTKWKLLQNPG